MKINFRQAEFVVGAASLAQVPDDGLPHVAFAGRSNVGKSSLLGALTGTKRLVKTSATPGKTRELNFFRVGGALHLVDFPGFGYAKFSKEERARISRLIGDYAAKCGRLRGIVYLVDLRTEGTALDLQNVVALGESGVPMLIVGTKGDKLGTEARAKALKAIREKFELEDDPMWVSSRTGEGVEELREAIGGALDEA